MRTSLGSHFRKRLAALATIVALCLGIGALADDARAAIVTDGCANASVSCTFGELLFDDASFSVGNQTFDDWAFMGSFDLVNQEEIYLSFSQIIVTPVMRLAELTGFNIHGFGDIGAPENLDWFLGFDYHVHSSVPVLAAGIELSEYAADSWAFNELYDEDTGSWMGTAVGYAGYEWDDYTGTGPMPMPTDLTVSSLMSLSNVYNGDYEPLDVTHLYLSAVTPVPEPLSVYMTLAGLVVVTTSARRRRAAARLRTSAGA